MAATDAGHSFGSIFLGMRGAVAQGQLRMTPNGFTWKRNGGIGKPVEIKKSDIESILWTKVPRGCQMGVRVHDGITTNFIGFRDKDLESLQSYCRDQYGQDIKELGFCTNGRNWGAVAVNGRSLMFMVDGKMTFEVPLPDVAQAQQVKDDVMLEFHADDDGNDERVDQLMEVAFHVPGVQRDARADGEATEPPAKFTDQDAASGDSAVASFSDVHVLAPRGRFEVEMYPGHMQLMGQAQDFKIRYPSIQRIFILPKTHTPHTLVVISLDPPIRKGQTYYAHILSQFPTDEEATVELQITADMLAAKNEKCGGKLEASMSGPINEVFARTLRGLSGAKITRPGAFRNAAKDGFAVRCLYKADDGYLYPLDRAFFYVHKPPMLIPFDDVASVELTRLDGNAVSSKTFDLVIRNKLKTQEYVFRSIPRVEWQGLLDFFQAKKLRVERLRETQAGQSNRAAIDFDEDDPINRMGGGEDDDDDEDEDFDAGGEGGSSDSGSEDDSDAEMIDEEGISAAAVGKKGKGGKSEKKRAPRDEESEGSDEEKEKKAKPAKKAKAEKGAKEEGKTKKGRAKKDPNAPKNALSAFMYFSNATREKIKAENPGMAFGEVGKALGERWKAISAEDKAPFEEMAKKDKERYQREMAAFKAGGSSKGGDDDE